MLPPARPLVAVWRRWLRLRPLHARHKFALLGVLGMLMVATPLVDVVRRQSQDLQGLLGARNGLEPVARAVDVQRALLAHRGSAALVLAGRGELEPERLARQHEVDGRLATLTDTLVRGRFAPALDEEAALREDWAALVERIAARRIGAADSDAAHRLLIEQVLQVMDLVGDVGGVVSGTLAAAELREARLAARVVLAFVGMEAARHGSVASDAANARRRLQSAVRAAAAAVAVPDAITQGAELVRTRTVARDALQTYLAALDAGEATRTDAAAAGLAGALTLWPAQALAAADATLAQGRDALARERAWWLGLFALLALAQCALMASTWLQLGARARGRRDSGEPAQGSERDGGESRQPTQHLLSRLRDPSRDPREEAPPSQL